MFVSSTAAAQYQLTNLVSNQVGAAKHVDPLLVNGWGLAYGPGGPFWVSDEGSGWSTLYDGSGVKQGLDVLVPTAGGDGPGSPTGIVFNGSQDFQVQGKPAVFLFATLDGTISGWSPQVNLAASIVAVTTPSAVYTGLAITSHASGNFLFAADNQNNKVDVFDGNFTLVNSFTDPTVPAGFTAFGIQDFGGLLYVSYASLSGGSGGYIDIYSEAGVLLKRLAQGSPLNQPWGFCRGAQEFRPSQQHPVDLEQYELRHN
ncbi:MAG: TIGR03118 family protein [Candidatus Sulfotelmatobacter sp.]